MRLTNLTPHKIVMIMAGGEKITFKPAKVEQLLRVITTSVVTDRVGGISILKPTHEVTGNIPEEIEGHYYIVSKQVAQALKGRKDFVYPTNVVHKKELISVIDQYGKEIVDNDDIPVKKFVTHIDGCGALSLP